MIFKKMILGFKSFQNIQLLIVMSFLLFFFNKHFSRKEINKILSKKIINN